MFTGEGRDAFLNFLRNLTPQIAFLTLALISGTRLDTRLQLDMDGFHNALPLLMSLFVFFGATIANISTFIDAMITSSTAMDDASAVIKNEFPAGGKRTRKLVVAAWKHNKPTLFRLILAGVVAESALVTVFMLALQGALASPFVVK